MKLVKGLAKRSLRDARILQLDHHQRQAVDEQHDVRPPLVLVFDHGELVDRKPVVVFRILQIQKPHLAVPLALRPHPGDVHAVGEHLVEPAVVLDKRRAFRCEQPSQGFVDCDRRKPRVDAFQRRAQSGLEHHIAIALPLRPRAVRREVRAEGRLPAEVAEFIQGQLFNVLFHKITHDHSRLRFRGSTNRELRGIRPALAGGTESRGDVVQRPIHGESFS